MFDTIHYYSHEIKKGLYACICGTQATVKHVTRNPADVTCNRCKNALMGHTNLK